MSDSQNQKNVCKKSASPYRNASGSQPRRSIRQTKEEKRKQIRRRNFFRFLFTIFLFLFSLFLLTLSIRFLTKSIRSSSRTAVPAEKESADLPEESELSISEETEETNTLQEETTPETVSEPTSTSITISICGDCTLGNEETFAYENSLGQYFDSYGSSYFFQNVKHIFEEDDLTIANLECSFTEATERSDHTFCFKAPASYTDILLDGSVEAVNLANNHTFDFLEQGYNDTRTALDAASIVHFGYEETAVMDVKGIKVGLVGTYEMIEGTGIETQLKANIEKVKADGAQIVIVIFHWGNELDLVPNYNQLYLAHKAVDFGADLVCGGHAHVLQGIETYKGKNILYGMANFCFGGNVYPNDLDTIIYQQTFTVDENGLIDDLVTNIIPCSGSSEEGFNNYQPTIATGERAQRILDKLAERTASLPEYSEY